MQIYVVCIQSAAQILSATKQNFINYLNKTRNSTLIGSGYTLAA